MLVTMDAILQRAKKENYAVLALDVTSELEVRAAIEVAEKLQAPIILMLEYYTHNKDFVQFGLDTITQIKKSKIPMAMHLDHGENFEQVMWAIRAGCTSVMADYSMLPYEENVALVKEVVKVAKPLGITVEAEFGHVGFGNNYAVDGVSNLTDPDLAAKYVEETGCDALAVAIGSAHGQYTGTPHLYFDRLEEIKKTVSIPLVLHGGSSTGDDNLAEAARRGMTKINICSDFYRAGRDEFLKALKEDENLDVYGYLPTFAKGFKNKMEHYIRLFGSVGKTWTPEDAVLTSSDTREDHFEQFDTITYLLMT